MGSAFRLYFVTMTLFGICSCGVDSPEVLDPTADIDAGTESDAGTQADASAGTDAGADTDADTDSDADTDTDTDENGEQSVIELAPLSPGKNEIQIKYDGHARRLIITTPRSFGPQGMYPALFCFHGAGGKADGQSERWSPHADERDMIVISLEAVQPLAKWNFKDNFHIENHDDVGFVSKVVQALIANKIVDPKAIYATGHSSGGLFCYRLAKETALFAALSPMSCGMAKDAHDPDEKTKPVSIMQVIGDQDKSFHGSSNANVTMYSAAKRIEIWRTFNQCLPDPLVLTLGEEVDVHTYVSQSGIEVALCTVKGQGHIIRKDLRDRADSAALDFLLKHTR